RPPPNQCQSSRCRLLHPVNVKTVTFRSQILTPLEQPRCFNSSPFQRRLLNTTKANIQARARRTRNSAITLKRPVSERLGYLGVVWPFFQCLQVRNLSMAV